MTPEKRLLPEVRLAVRYALDCGLQVSLVTGRMFPAVARWVAELGLQTPQVGNNGADIVDPVTGLFLQNLCLEPQIVPVVLRAGEELAVTTVVFAGKRVLALRRTPDHWLIERNNEAVEVVSFDVAAGANLRVEKLLFLDHQDPERLPRLRDELARRLAAAALPACSLEITEPGILNICHPQANKGVALRRLADLCGVTLAEVAAIGDSDNDAAMVALAGLGIAMGNATAATRQAARVQVADNAHAGVVSAIVDHVLAGVALGGAGILAVRLRELRLQGVVAALAPGGHRNGSRT